MSLDPTTITALAGIAGALAGYGIRVVEAHLTARSQHAQTVAAEKKTVLNGYGQFTDRLQTRLTHVEAQLDATNQRLAQALDRLDEVEAENRRLKADLAQARAEIDHLTKGAPCQ